MPRRRRGAKAIAADAERGLAMRILLHSPKDVIAGALAFAAVSAIIANALFLQRGPHPSPMFGAAVTVPAAAMPASPLPRPRPVEAADQVEARARRRNPRHRSFEPSNSRREPRAVDRIRLANLVKATSRAGGDPQRSAAAGTDSGFLPQRQHCHVSPGLAPRGGGAARAHRIWLRPVEADRHRRLRHPGRDPEIRTGAQDPGDRADVRSAGARTDRDDRPINRSVHSRSKAAETSIDHLAAPAAGTRAPPGFGVS